MWKKLRHKWLTRDTVGLMMNQVITTQVIFPWTVKKKIIKKGVPLFSYYNVYVNNNFFSWFCCCFGADDDGRFPQSQNIRESLVFYFVICVVVSLLLLFSWFSLWMWWIGVCCFKNRLCTAIYGTYIFYRCKKSFSNSRTK